tara:strand:- start:186 stop:755 length:570 start_codon:yes stop_codon:yes gene_type:complete
MPAVKSTDATAVETVWLDIKVRAPLGAVDDCHVVPFEVSTLPDAPTAVKLVPPLATASVPPSVIAPVVAVAGVKPVELPENDVTPPAAGVEDTHVVPFDVSMLPEAPTADKFVPPEATGSGVVRFNTPELSRLTDLPAGYVQNTSLVPVVNATAAPPLLDDNTVVLVKSPALIVPIPTSHSDVPELVIP